jgi:hypothetical protein
MKTKMHFTDACLLNPTHPVTVNLIGCGGTGSQVLQKMVFFIFSTISRKTGSFILLHFLTISRFVYPLIN